MIALVLLMSGAVLAESRLPAGTVIEASHVSGCQAPCALVGRQLTRTVFEGREVVLGDTKMPDLVQRNALVTLVARKGAMRLEAEGRALGAGGEGEEISVMNTATRRVVSGTVLASGLVEVRP
ncbi:flagellar basal body P-ring formation chaperone FlgA [Parvularcula dongshanensis]|uniref:Flagella basal body P-ring formation protein FlgA n=1 Tax=Parvularcula dongshanensis TaxID=1173995 RepID=A0A840I5T3_9PROT|nr:flagellar basal body P-ring formation chaperone FlgA [Parvularcula dongshanensis]MBB4659631.1 flagella basal body P-ring formation protein FlgA [Parvularcula dongshanensis]